MGLGNGGRRKEVEGKGETKGMDKNRRLKIRIVTSILLQKDRSLRKKKTSLYMNIYIL